MMQNSKNIYQASRMAAGYTQERAAELLSTSVRSLAAFETEERIPDAEMVVRMVDVYGTQFLAYQHLRATMEIAKDFLPEVNQTNLPIAVLRLQKELNDVIRLRDEITEIACDGKVSDIERMRWDAIKSELIELCQAIFEIDFAKEDG